MIFVYIDVELKNRKSMKNLNLENIIFCVFDSMAYDLDEVNAMTDEEVAKAVATDWDFSGYYDFEDFVAYKAEGNFDECFFRVISKELKDKAIEKYQV